MRSYPEELTPREWAEWNNQKEMWELQAAHEIQVKKLEIEVQKLEARWSVWLKIPLVILSLPVRVLLIIPLSIYAAKKQEVPQEIWKLLRWL